MNAGRRDMVPCLKAPPPRPEAPRWDEPLPQTSNKMMEIWGRFLMKAPTKVVVVILSICLLAVGSCGATLVSEEFQIRVLAKDGSAFIRFQDTLLEYFTNDLQVDLIIETGVNYSDPITQMKIDSLTQIIEDNKFYRPVVRSWFAELKKWHRTENIENTLLGL
jgi:predicted RND superfamily exporter protein